MTRSPMPLEFKNADQRDKWITDNADYFTVIQRKNRQYKRIESPNLPAAEKEAHKILAGDPEARLLIYAVYDPARVGSSGALSAYVKTMAFKDMETKYGKPA